MIEIDLNEFPAVKKWTDRIEAREAVKKGVKVGSSRSPEEMKKAFADVRLPRTSIRVCIAWLTDRWFPSIRTASLRVARCERRSQPWTTATSTSRLRSCTVRLGCMRVFKRSNSTSAVHCLVDLCCLCRGNDVRRRLAEPGS